MEKERFMPACVQIKTFNFNYNNSLMLSVKKKNKRLVGESTLSEFYFLAKAKNLSVHLQMIF